MKKRFFISIALLTFLVNNYAKAFDWQSEVVFLAISDCVTSLDGHANKLRDLIKTDYKRYPYPGTKHSSTGEITPPYAERIDNYSNEHLVLKFCGCLIDLKKKGTIQDQYQEKKDKNGWYILKEEMRRGRSHLASPTQESCLRNIRY